MCHVMRWVGFALAGALGGWVGFCPCLAFFFFTSFGFWAKSGRVDRGCRCIYGW
ncbi:hypothetical protein AOQ84DRAFT_107015 [Glonium stellatum]|uniref:Uncharacterized protein n=1 Tax=Glonium stellatum TaxID=574774 RepID=A0A8E2EU49_9PEZI|nr:hypothetical protein AOQ84DRAFT_107015 [Glonium stellatum]